MLLRRAVPRKGVRRPGRQEDGTGPRVAAYRPRDATAAAAAAAATAAAAAAAGGGGSEAGSAEGEFGDSAFEKGFDKAWDVTTPGMVYGAATAGSPGGPDACRVFFSSSDKAVQKAGRCIADQLTHDGL